jgi:NAD-dependent deacetylase
MKKITVLTGAGISAESGLKTFRDADGLWEGHRIEEVATPEAWSRNPAMVLDFYNQRRAQLLEAEPNEAHRALANLQSHYFIQIVTQNVDDLHERAGSNEVIHLHGELLSARSTGIPHLVYPWRRAIRMGDSCEMGYQLRPHIVWFGEPVPLLDKAAAACGCADIGIIIGTSLQVYPAASLVSYYPPDSPIYYIDPKPGISIELSRRKNLKVIPLPATKGLTKLIEEILL